MTLTTDVVTVPFSGRTPTVHTQDHGRSRYGRDHDSFNHPNRHSILEGTVKYTYHFYNPTTAQIDSKTVRTSGGDERTQ